MHLCEVDDDIDLMPHDEPSEQQQDDTALLELRDALQKAIDKLKDSNRQLQAAIDNGDPDPEYKQAIGV